MRARLALGGLGVVAIGYGAWLLLSRQDLGPVAAVLGWLAAGVILHDFVLVPLTVTLLAAGSWVLPRRWGATASIALLVTGSVSLLAIPVLGRFGARADNPTLLDRDYLLGEVVLVGAALVAAVLHVCAVGWRDRRSRNGGARGSDSGGR